MRLLFLLPVLLAACAPSVSSSSSASTPRLVSSGQVWTMTVEGQRGESELLVDTLRDEGRDGYFYYTKSRLVQARMVSDRFIVDNDDDGTPGLLRVIRFEVEMSGGAPRACFVPRPVQVAPGESLQGVYMTGTANERFLSVSGTPSKEALAADIRCTLTRVK